MTHTPKIISYGALGIVTFFIIFASFWYRKEANSDTKLDTHSLEATTTEKVHNISEKAREYEFKVEYPFINESLAGAKDANRYLRELYTKRATEFKTEALSSYKGSPAELVKEGVASYYNVSSHEEANTNRYISIFVASESYFIGMAHPMHSIDTFIFDKKTGRLVMPKELFSNSSYPTVLSELARADFTKRNKTGDAERIIIDTTENNDGLRPTPDNFSLMLPTVDGLMVYFTEYQVASYAAGPQQVAIPYDKLQTIIDKESVLGEYIQ